ncbi:hypothetical protein SAMN04515667_2571 [Formosa sp. Hel1_31_208]|uniref:hypothetical protein n=1 Tax=Formosa sp. Hel1_31_208 TaxID=1798225 RepID=UPI00087D23D5|nr:hypothetical protein [Formosa sp. Hel1_31_208]SDS61389.1 hypothetical protein SAMN04515667_2571 [Formosa sp. Hel1_31_208]
MKPIFKFLCIAIFSCALVACSSSDDSTEDCTKTITIPQIYFVNNQSYNYDISQEVPCDFPEPEDAVVVEPPTLDNFNYQVLSFVFTPDTGNNTSRLQFEIQLNNPNDFVANGVPILTISSDELEFSGSYSNNAAVPCYQIDANSNCILTFDMEESLDLGAPSSVELLDVVYYLTN